MSEGPAVVGVTGGALGLSALALAFGVCCVAPWAVTLLGVAGAVLLARLAFFQPYIVAATIVLLRIGFWFVYRPRTSAACNFAQQRRLRRLVWSAAIIVIAIDVASFAPRLPKDARVKIYVVHEPVIGESNRDIPAAAELLHTNLARQYWNPTGAFGRQMSQVLGLLHGSRSIYAWDVYLIYPPNAVWSERDPPQPSYLMHQLSGLDTEKFALWNGKIFATKVIQTLAASDQKN